MTRHQNQSRTLPARKRPAGVSLPLLSVATFFGTTSNLPQLGVDRDPIATRPLFIQRLLACQGLFAHIHSQSLEHFSKYLTERLHSKSLSLNPVSVGFDANENGLTYAKRSFASGAKEND